MSDPREVFEISRERLQGMISTAFDDGTTFARRGDVTDDDVRVESDRYAESFCDDTWWREAT